MQNYLLGMIEKRIVDAGTTPVRHSAWPNIGTLYAMEGTKAQLTVAYNFQDEYCTITLRAADGFEKTYNYLRYTESDKIDEMLALVTQYAQMEST